MGGGDGGGGRDDNYDDVSPDRFRPLRGASTELTELGSHYTGPGRKTPLEGASFFLSLHL